jgi:hypothetical protein
VCCGFVFSLSWSRVLCTQCCQFDCAPFEEGEGLGERRGSLDERHTERVRSVDQLVGEWEGTVLGLLQRMGKDWAQLSKVSFL